MNLQLALIALSLIFLVVWLKMRRIRPQTAGKKELKSHNAQKISAVLAKGTPTPCLISDGRLFGESFHEKTPPALPCCEGCTCKLENVRFRSSDVFVQQKTSETKYDSDLGQLGFLEYKYYKYSLVLFNADLKQGELESFEEIRRDLRVDESFKERVRAHLDNGPGEKASV